MIEISDLCKCYETGNKKITAANKLNLRINDGEFVSIIGRSGSGKSTFLHLIGGLLPCDSGRIIVNDLEITSLKAAQLAEYHLKETGFVFQAFNLEHQYTIYDNIRIALVIAGVPWSEHKERIEKVLEKVGLAEKIYVKASDLSGGEKQRVAIARALINEPDLILADEPCGNLDSANSEMIMNIFSDMHKSGKTIVLVTHDMIDAAKAERIIEISDGAIIKDEKNINTMA